MIAAVNMTPGWMLFDVSLLDYYTRLHFVV